MTWAVGKLGILLFMLAILAAGQPLQDVQAAIDRKDYATALRIVRPLAQSNDPAAQSILGTLYALGYGVPQSYTEAVNWFRKSAEQGHPGAQG